MPLALSSAYRGLFCGEMRYALGIKRELIAFGFGRCDRGFGFWGIALAKLNEVIAFGLVKYDCAFGLVECAIIFFGLLQICIQ
ncbi:MAG: hypothetical protein HC785_09395 [Calothrix sp. CSU_2_0]|nr:hypothetical protein [Calothrix sp. CSU_2_0]